jgi:Transposase DNA-binding/Transposase Tn5 dimerisation domain/Transposase DDE domain
MLPGWVVDEMKAADLRDKRLNRRLTKVLAQLSAHPTASIPAACGGNSETRAAYRMFNNKKATFDSVLAPHIESTEQRVAAQQIVITTTDTTELDLTRPEQQVEEAGPLDDGARYGALLHGTYAFTPDGTPLGAVEAVSWARADDKVSSSSMSRAERQAMPFEDKESCRWRDSLQASRELAGRCPNTHIVWVADSEADIFEVIAAGMEEPRPPKWDWIVRACQDRSVISEGANSHLREAVMATPVLFRKEISVRGRKAKVSCESRGRRQPRQSRRAEMEVRATRVKLRGPWRPGGKAADVEVNVVLVSEVNPPADDVPVEWLLITSLPIDSAEQVRLVVEYYSVRWMVEVFFRTLKSGCRVERRRFERLEAVLPCVAVYLIVAWRTLLVCRMGRAFPDIDCEAIFEPSEWKSVYWVVHRKPPPAKPPTLQEMVRMVAQLGGYVNCKRKDEPGPQTVWLGLQRLHDISLCWEVFGPGSNRGP